MERREEQSGVTPPPAAPGDQTAPAAAQGAASDAGERRQEPGPDRRQSVVDRRFGIDRRQLTRDQANYDGPERRSGIDRRAIDEATGDTGLERRRGPGRRRSDDRRSAEEGEMTAEQFEFVKAIETYKKVNKRMYPTWTEVLEVIRQLGYRKVCPRDIHLDNVPEPAIQKVA